VSETFLTTRWSIVARAGEWKPGEPAPQSAREAFGELVRAYWPPLYAYARARGSAGEDAADLVQGFFARAVEKGDLVPREQRTRFRTFLIAAFRNFSANEHDRANAQKRGGAHAIVSLDELASTRSAEEARWQPIDGESPERIFERRYAQRVIERTLDRLRDEQAQAGKRAAFARMEPLLTCDDAAASYAEIARELHTTEGALKVAVHRLRRRFGELLREEIAGTVAAPDEIDAELRELRGALGT
jgi:RNA polymerase sigma-70 factor (ECF subfamily)